MTRFSLSSPDAPSGSEIAAIAQDLRRQREDLQRQRLAAGASSATTAQLLEKIEELRRRSEALAAHDSQDPI